MPRKKGRGLWCAALDATFQLAEGWGFEPVWQIEKPDLGGASFLRMN
jgi:hypothetical protein